MSSARTRLLAAALAVGLATTGLAVTGPAWAAPPTQPNPPTATPGAAGRSTLDGPGSPPADLLAHPKTETWPYGSTTLPGSQPGALRVAMDTAMATARRTHQAVPVDEATTPYTTLSANPDGTFTARQDIEPQRVRQGTRWVPVDSTLTRGADGRVRPRATVTNLVLSGGGTGPAAVQDDGAGHVLTFTWPSALPTPTIDGSTATYANVYPGVDLQLVAQPTGLRDLFVVHDAKAAANPALRTVALGATATGLTLSTGTDGAVQAVDPSGHRVFGGHAAMMWDSSGDTSVAHLKTIPVRVRSGQVEVTPDQDMLRSAATVYPAVIDPQFTEDAQDWIEIWSNGTTVEHGSWSPWAGYDTRAVRVGNSSGTLVRSLLSFDATRLPRPGTNANEALYVVAANLNLKRQPTASHSCVNTDVWRANPFNSNSNWGNQNGGSNTNLWPTSGTSEDGTTWRNPIGRTVSCAANPDWSTVDVTQQVRDVYISGGSTYTIGLRATNEGPTSGNYGSFNVQNGDGGNSYVSITYVAEPSLGAISVGQDVVGNHGDHRVPCGPDSDHPGYLPMQTGSIPMSAPLGEPDAGRWVQYYMALNDWSAGGAYQSTTPIAAQGPTTARGTLAKASSTADANGNPYGSSTMYLQDGHKYQIYAQAMDDVNLTNGGNFVNSYGRELYNAFTDFYNNRWGNTGAANYPTSGSCWVVAALTPPAQATFTHSDFPAAGQHLASYPTVGTVGRIGVSSTATTPIVQFDYAINTDSTNEGAGHCPTTSPADACGTAGVTAATRAGTDIVVPADTTHQGMNHLFVSAVDAAGNVSAYARFDFFMAAAYQKVNFGDVTGDGVPDVMAVDNAGNLVTYPTNLDPTPAADNAVRAASAASAPNDTSWATSLYTHRGSVRVQPTDDLVGWGKDSSGTGHLYYYYNSQQPGAGTLADAFTQTGRAEIYRPSCSPSAATDYCTGYDQSTWNNVVQIAAIGPVLGGCDITAPTAACKTNLITIETDPAGGPAREWLFSPAGVGRLANPVLLSTSTSTWEWEKTTLLVPGNAAGHPGGSGGMPDLWARDGNGTLWQFTNTSTPTNVGAGLGDLTAKTQLGQAREFATYKWINTAGDLNGDGKPDLWTMDQQDQMGVVLSPIGTGTSTIPNALYAQKANNATAPHWGTASGVASIQGAAKTAGIAGQLVSDQADSANASRRLCVDDLNGGTADGTSVEIYDCNGTFAQQWYFAPDGTIQAMGSNPAAPPGKCLDTGGSLLVAAKLALYTCSAARAGYQTWRLVPSPSTPDRFSLYNPDSGMCMDDTGYGTNNTNPFQLWPCWDAAPQHFTLPTGPGQIQKTEAESIWNTNSGGSVITQDGSTWSNGRQTMLVNSTVNSSITLNYYVANAGIYQVMPTMTQAVDYGRVSLSVDGKPLPRVFDGYHDGVVAVSFKFGSVYLGTGNHAFTFQVTGTNSASTGNRYNAGIDLLKLVPTGSTAPSAQLSVSPTSGDAPLTVTARASASAGGGAPISSYTFDFGDGTTVGPQSASSASHTYNGPAGTYVVKVTVTDTAGLKSATTVPVTVTAGGTATTPSYVGRVASTTGSTSATSLGVQPGASGVRAGDTLLVSLLLTNTKPGIVSATDSKGNVYTQVLGQSDSAGDTTVVLAATNVAALTSTDTITVTFPATGEQHLAVDELSGVTAVDQHASATGATSTFDSGPTPTTTAANELVFGVAGVEGGSSAAWAAGFTALPTLSVSGDQLATAWQQVTAAGGYNASGTVSKTWMAAVLTVR